MKYSLPFSNRDAAARALAQKLDDYRGKNPLILGIPRGSVAMAKTLADELEGELDVVLVHKIGAPDNPEFAVGSVSEFGTIYRSEAVEHFEVPSEYIEKAAQLEVANLKDRRRIYSPIRPPVSPKSRIVIIVDDGIATGSTMLAAARAIRSQNPLKLIIAAPVASHSAVDLLESEANELVVLETPERFFSISQFYQNFPQVTDEDVMNLLTQSMEKEKHVA